MIKYFYISLFVLFVLFLVFNYKKTDSFTNKHNIILLGDSILNNSKYVKQGQSIEDILQKCDCEALIFAQDGAKIIDVYSQIDKILINFKHFNI